MVNRVAAGGLQVRPYFYRYTDDALDEGVAPSALFKPTAGPSKRNEPPIERV